MAKYFQIKNSKINKIFIRGTPYVTPYPPPPFVNPLYVAPRYGIAIYGGTVASEWFSPNFQSFQNRVCSKIFSVKFSIVSKWLFPKNFFCKIFIHFKMTLPKNFFCKIFTCSKMTLPKNLCFSQGGGGCFENGSSQKIFFRKFFSLFVRNGLLSVPECHFLVNGR